MQEVALGALGPRGKPALQFTSGQEPLLGPRGCSVRGGSVLHGAQRPRCRRPRQSGRPR